MYDAAQLHDFRRCFPFPLCLLTFYRKPTARDGEQRDHD
jgi:hypothetical protein